MKALDRINQVFGELESTGANGESSYPMLKKIALALADVIDASAPAATAPAGKQATKPAAAPPAAAANG